MYTLGLDIGYSNLKVAHGMPGRDPVRTVLPAGAGPADRLPAALVPTQNDPSAKVLIDGVD